jgi:hypothetical protein
MFWGRMIEKGTSGFGRYINFAECRDVTLFFSKTRIWNNRDSRRSA